MHDSLRNIRSALGLLLVLQAFGPQAYAQECEGAQCDLEGRDVDGRALVATEDYPSALAHFAGGCESGDSGACVSMEALLADHPTVRTPAFERRLRRACLAQNDGLCAQLGRDYVDDIGRTRRGRGVDAMLSSACTRDVAAACTARGVRTQTRQRRHPERARPDYESACRLRDGRGCRRLGELVERTSTADAVGHFAAGCRLGDLISCGSQGRLIVTSDPVGAAPLLTRACAANDGDACVALGRLHETGGWAGANVEAGERAFASACELLDHPEACGRLGRRLRHRGEDAAAEPALQTSCRARYGAACLDLAAVFAARGNTGQARAQYRRGRRALIRTCRAGTASDCEALSTLYRAGHGVRANAAQATRWYRRACDGGAGDAGRCCELGHAPSCQVAQLSAANAAAATTLRQMEAAVARESEARRIAEAASARETLARERAEEGAAAEARARQAAQSAAVNQQRQAAERLAEATRAQEQARASLARESAARLEAESALAQQTHARRLAEALAQNARAEVDRPATAASTVSPAPTAAVTPVGPEAPDRPVRGSEAEGNIDWNVTAAVTGPHTDTNGPEPTAQAPAIVQPVEAPASAPPASTLDAASVAPEPTGPTGPTAPTGATAIPRYASDAADARWAAAAAAREAEARSVAEAQRLRDTESARALAAQAAARDAEAESAARAAVQEAQRAAAEAAAQESAARRDAAAAVTARRAATAAAAAEASRRRQAAARAATRRRQIEQAAAQQTRARERAAAAEAAARLRAQEAAEREAAARQQAREAAAREAAARAQAEEREAAERREAQLAAAREARARRVAEQAAAAQVLARERAENQARIQAAARARAEEREAAERARLAALVTAAAEEQRQADLRQQELTRAAEAAQARQEAAAAAANARRAAQQLAAERRAAAQRTLVQQREEQRTATRARVAAERRRVAAARAAERERRAEATRLAAAGPPPVREFIRMCDAGDRDACQSAGMLVRDGEGVDADATQALTYLERACNESHTTSCTAAITLLAASNSPHPGRLARLHEPLCVSENETEACERALTVLDDSPDVDMALYVRLATQACESGQARSCVRLGDARVHGRADAEARSAAAEIYARTCAGDSPLGCPGVSDMCATGVLAACEHLLGACDDEVQGACERMPSAAARAPSGPLDMTQSPQNMATRGLEEIGEARFLEGESSLLAALGHTNDPWITEHREGLELALRFAGQRLGWLVAPCTRPGTEVFVLGNEGSPTACDVPMRVPLGENQVELRAAGYQSIRQSAHVNADASTELDVLLAPFECESPAMTHIAGIDGGCCWDDQSWEDGECVGVPSCSLEMQVNGDECVPFDPNAQKVSRFRLSLFGGITNFVQSDTGLFRDGVREDGASFQLGPRVEIRAGVRLASVLTLEATFASTFRSVDTWLDCAPGMSCTSGSPSTYSLDAGLMLQLHTSPRRALGNFAFHVGVGVRPWARISFDGQGEAGSLTAVVLPGELGASLYLGSAVSLSLAGQAEMWLAHSYCGNTVDGGRYCLDGGELSAEFAWSGQLGINFHL